MGNIKRVLDRKNHTLDITPGDFISDQFGSDSWVPPFILGLWYGQLFHRISLLSSIHGSLGRNIFLCNIRDCNILGPAHLTFGQCNIATVAMYVFFQSTLSRHLGKSTHGDFSRNLHTKNQLKKMLPNLENLRANKATQATFQDDSQHKSPVLVQNGAKQVMHGAYWANTSSRISDL